MLQKIILAVSNKLPVLAPMSMFQDLESENDSGGRHKNRRHSFKYHIFATGHIHQHPELLMLADLHWLLKNYEFAVWHWWIKCIIFSIRSWISASKYLLMAFTSQTRNWLIKDNGPSVQLRLYLLILFNSCKLP